MNLNEHNFIVETDWLAENLGQANLQVIECTSLLPNYFEEDADQGLRKESGLTMWEESHIPGAGFADILGELSDQTNDKLMYAMPSAAQFAEVMGKLGVDAGVGVVLYDRNMNMWASRLWWMLRAFGHENAAVLNGGWEKWLKEGRPISSDVPNIEPKRFEVKESPQLIADSSDVLNAIENEGVQLINALDPDEFAGRPPQRYARAGRIPTSSNVPFMITVDPDTCEFLSDDKLQEVFAHANADQKDGVICYCGGGIAACNTALLLTRLGKSNVAVYDGSMMEWAANPELPMESG